MEVAVDDVNPWADMDMGDGVAGATRGEHVSDADKWEQCMGGCGVWLKAGKWGVCAGCWRRGHAGRIQECEAAWVLCRGCGVHVKSSPGACKPCLREEAARSGEAAESTIASQAAAPAVLVSDRVSSLVAGKHGGAPRTHQKKCSSGG